MSTYKIIPPGHLNDLDEAGQAGWSNEISSFIDFNIQRYELTQFFNPTRHQPDEDAVTQKIDWTAFPKAVNQPEPRRWMTADSNRFRFHDEYCEWQVDKNSEGKVIRITFTSEGPEYWAFLAENAPDTLLELYRDLVSCDVEMDDLLDGSGDYNPNNKWNDGSSPGAIAHLAHVNNTLGAFVNIGARATIIRQRPDGTPMTDALELIECGRYGAPNRHSDPHIGSEVNTLARAGYRITMANPVGLSMDGFFPAGFETPDGTDVTEFWTVVRGTEEFQLRTVFEVPPEKDYVVGDITRDGSPIEFGGQIADFIRVKLVGLADQKGQHLSQARPCDGDELIPSSETANLSQTGKMLRKMVHRPNKDEG